MAKRRPILAVVGGNHIDDERILNAASAVGGAIAREGAILLTGGKPKRDSMKIKEVAMQGAVDAASADGVVARLLGFLPEDKGRPLRPFDTQYFISTGLSSAERNPVTAMTCDAMIVFEGEAGTLSELGFALAMGKPVYFAGSSKRLKRAAENKKKLLDKLEDGGGRYSEITLAPDEIARLVVERLIDAPEVVQVSDDSAWTSQVVNEAIGKVGAKRLAQASDFPASGVPNLTKDQFEELLQGMQ